MPGTVGDSEGTHHDNRLSPMARIHNRRDGDLLSYEEVLRFLSPERFESKDLSGESNPSDYEYGHELSMKEKSALKWGHYWTEEQKKEFLQSDTDLTLEDLGWENLEVESHQISQS